MNRKDCDNSMSQAGKRIALNWALLCVAVTVSPVVAGTVRVRPSAIASGPEILLGDVCDLSGFEADVHAQISGVLVGTAPKSRRTVTIPADSIRRSLRQSEVNMAGVTFAGAMQCIVSVRAGATRMSPRVRSRETRNASLAPIKQAPTTRPGSLTSSTAQTLRDAIQKYFEVELERYRAQPDIVFDRADDDVIGIAGALTDFTIRRGGGSPVGSVRLDIDVREAGKVLRTISLTVKVSMIRKILVARRAINRGATLGAKDTEHAMHTFSRVDARLGITDADRVAGKRAKRFIPAGSVIRMDLLENVPLVVRGQLVRLTSRKGGVQVVTSAKAVQGGILGEVITVRSPDHGRVEFEATIVGPGVVEIGTVISSPLASLPSAKGAF